LNHSVIYLGLMLLSLAKQELTDFDH